MNYYRSREENLINLFIEFQLIHQIKIFVTALMLWLMLDHQLSWQQWFALLLLAVGIADIQIQHIPANRIPEINQKPLLGFIAVITMCFTSAFASISLLIS